MRQNEPLPDFDCAEIQQFDPRALMSEPPSDMDLLMLGLALAFNDLKGLLIVSWWMKPHTPKNATSPTAYLGQFSGMQIQLQRLVAGIAHEILVLLREHEHVISGADFQKLLAALPRRKQPKLDPRRRWRQLIAAARERKGGTATTLQRVRDTVAFHYYQPKKLSQCYSERFLNAGKKSAFLKHAYVSLGASMERTRFYFVDVAAEGVLNWASKQVGRNDFAAEIEDIAGAINFAIGPLLVEHIKQKTGLRVTR
ncbi:MAG: hypothetical protein IPK60_10335 [Sandaracinaceae bacterium]|nr:hypothetical protein [Sandaracinaceae bacterium]